jgi:predicted ATPase
VLKTLRLHNFKSWCDSGEVELDALTVLFGPNSAGKSNFIDGVLLLSRLASERTLSDAFGGPIRGRAIEAFRFGSGGLSEMLNKDRAVLGIEARVAVATKAYRYRVEVALLPRSGELVVEDEYLATLTKRGGSKGNPSIERVGDVLHIRRKRRAARPYGMERGNFAVLSDRRFSGDGYEPIEDVRKELSSIRAHYLDPRVAMRAAQAPSEVTDIGPLGQHVAAFLYRAKAHDQGRQFAAIERTLRTLIPSIDRLSVDLNEQRGEIELGIVQDGIAYSSRVVSEGTLRVLALCCMAANPFPVSLLAFEEPENGVHPRRVQLIARLLIEMARKGRQILVTTHSPLFVGEVLRLVREEQVPALLYNVVRREGGSNLTKFEPTGPLWENGEIRRSLADPTDEVVLEAAMLRGLLDG